MKRLFWILPGVLLALAGVSHAEGYREFPCIECDAYDYGWFQAASAEFTEPEECDYEIEDDWDEDYVAGCLAYVEAVQRRRGIDVE